MARFGILGACTGFVLVIVTPCTSVVADDGRGAHYTLRPTKGSTSYSATITTNRQGVWIDVRARGSSSGAYAAPGKGSGITFVYAANPSASYSRNGAGAGSDFVAITRSWYDPIRGTYSQTPDGHVYHLGGINISSASAGKDGWVAAGMQQHPGSVPEGLYVNGHFQGIVWVPINGHSGNVQLAPAPAGSATGAGEAPIVIDPRAVAMVVLEHIPLPNVTIRVNPDLGMVAMPGWFWAEGYNGEPFGGSATVGSYTVSVQVQPSSYTWSFGDGSTLVTQTLGRPYPAESDIKHTYQYSSLQYPDGFPVHLTIQFTASYSVDGGPAVPLPGMERTYAAAYRVQELQSILTNR